ncbi:MAG: flagellar basal-body MS-ring/collar protein FliF [Bdellovibrionota bacterium]
MGFDIGKIFENLVSFFVKLPLSQKIALPLLIAGSMGMIIFVSRWASRPEYQVLFSNLEEPDAAGVVEFLKDHKIGYQLSDEGKTVWITPPSLVHETRLELSSAGLPKGGNKGYELFDKPTLGATAVMEGLNKNRAIQGELERTIQSIDAVRVARVHLNIPERSAFVKRDTMPTAAVLLRLKPGQDLTAAQVAGITHLVAGAIDRLTPDNVTVMDSHGNLLSEKKEPDDLNGADVKRLDYQRQIESAYAKRIETMLSEILGAGRAVARVTADLDFSKFEKEEEAYDPAGTVARSERSIEQNAGSKAEGGVAGVVSNLTNDPNLLTPPDSKGNNNTHREVVKNFEISRAVSRTAQAAGKIQRLSVAVLVDGQRIKVPGAEKDAAGVAKMVDQYRPLPPDMMRKIENLVKQAVGFDNTRGDTVTVENIRFLTDDVIDKALSEIESRTGVIDLWVKPFLIPIVFIAFFFLVLVSPLMKFLVRPTESEVDLSRLLPAGIAELEAELEAERSKLGAIPEIQVPAVDIEELEAILAENQRLVKENPQQAALLIRYWLNDGRI